MLQLVYVSSVNPAAGSVAPEPILQVSRRLNARDDITGLLYSDGRRFLQALEGPEEAVEAAFARIEADPRHRAIVLLSRRIVDRREFGDWMMAHRTTAEDLDEFLHRIRTLVARASPEIRATFEGFAELRRAA
ncbi:BLUF domain-containing protein [Stakelama tenebrarum]|uniref:BLUF domain-containing protein n=1 Tax=Stakelama tenebrarum TaxID=2711215 RepID=A0A6G6Y838_9SPHN|nr:BLUF domain-containing protein [Sphingosinithalassobacter tenebrarum]QIG81011.1 BLUF domain-containing protein [Sphingosinithalassobacter tenebrarum]